jgi:hypothetical protein
MDSPSKDIGDQIAFKMRRQKTKKKKYEKDADNNLSSERMRSKMNRRHPRTKDSAGKRKKIPICFSSTGWHLCCLRFRKTDLKDMGVGVCLYFKWLKYITCLLTVVSIFSIPALTFFIGASQDKPNSN